MCTGAADRPRGRHPARHLLCGGARDARCGVRRRGGLACSDRRLLVCRADGRRSAGWEHCGGEGSPGELSAALVTHHLRQMLIS